MYATFQNKSTNFIQSHHCKFLTKKTIKDVDGKKKEVWYMEDNGDPYNVKITLPAKDYRLITVKS